MRALRASLRTPLTTRTRLVATRRATQAGSSTQTSRAHSFVLASAASIICWCWWMITLTRFKFEYPLVARRDAPAIIRRFIASFNALASRPGGSMRCVGTLHTDGAGEFTSHKFRDELADSRINKSESPPEVHALNGVAERAIRSIFSHVRADLAASAAPKSFWPEATDHAVDILNRTTCPPHGRCTAHEALTGEKPRVMSLWPWGCRAWAVQPTAYRLSLIHI